MSAVSVVSSFNLPLALLRVNEAVLIKDDNQNESLLHPCQAISHNCKFNLAPMGYRDSNNEMGNPKLSVDDQITLFNFNGRKLFRSIRKPIEDELRNLPIV